MATHTAVETTENRPTAIDECVPFTEAELDRIGAAGGAPDLGMGPCNRAAIVDWPSPPRLA